jgi:O-antigen ligase
VYLEKKDSISWLNKAIWYCIILYAVSNIFSIAVVQAAAAALIILFVIKRIFLGDSTLGRSGSGTPSERGCLCANPLNLPFLFFIITRVLSVMLSVNPGMSITSLYREMVFYPLFYVFICEIDIRNSDRMRLLFRIIILSSAGATLYGMAKYIFVAPERITSTTSGYYTLGMYLSAVLALSLMLGRSSGIFPSRIYWWTANLILSVGILFTFDRMHWVSMIISIVIAGIVKERRFLLVSIALIGIFLLFNPSLYERLLMTITDYHTSERDVIWKGAYLLIDKHPVFGFGPATFKEIFPLFDELRDKGVGNWHNDFIQVYIESGLVGVLSFVCFLISLTIYGFRALKKFSQPSPLPPSNGESRNAFLAELTQALLLSLLAFVVAGFLADVIALLLFLLLMSVLALIAGLVVKRRAFLLRRSN